MRTQLTTHRHLFAWEYYKRGELENKCFETWSLGRTQRRKFWWRIRPSEKSPYCGCKLSSECKQTNTCNFLADAWRPWHVHTLSHKHRQAHTLGMHPHTCKTGWFYTQWEMKKDSYDITRDRPAVTDSNSEVRRHINLNHLTYCSQWVGGVRGLRGTEADDER